MTVTVSTTMSVSFSVQVPVASASEEPLVVGDDTLDVGASEELELADS